MICVKEATKLFGKFAAIKNISCNIREGKIYGLVGVNGAGKSTLLRTMTGIYRCDSGSVTLDGSPIYDNPYAKSKIAFVPDELYLPPNSTLSSLSDKYASLYPRFNYRKFVKLVSDFELKLKAQFNQYSKGMKRQAATALALALEPQYIFFDETFDGLDPFKRNYVKKIIAEDVNTRGICAVITSHSLRELEDSCDQLALLNSGGLVFESDTAKLKTSRFKVQIAFSEPFDEKKFAAFDVISFKKQGAVASLILGGERDATLSGLRAMSPALLEELPMSLEEVFTYELELRGISNLGGGVL